MNLLFEYLSGICFNLSEQKWEGHQFDEWRIFIFSEQIKQFHEWRIFFLSQEIKRSSSPNRQKDIHGRLLWLTTTGNLQFFPCYFFLIVILEVNCLLLMPFSEEKVVIFNTCEGGYQITIRCDHLVIFRLLWKLGTLLISCYLQMILLECEALPCVAVREENKALKLKIEDLTKENAQLKSTNHIVVDMQSKLGTLCQGKEISYSSSFRD